MGRFALDFQECLKSVDLAAVKAASLEVRFACLAYATVEGMDNRTARLAVLTGMCNRLRVPQACRELAVLLARAQPLESLPPESPEWLLDFLESADAFRRSDRFADLIEGIEIVYAAKGSLISVSGVLASIHRAFLGASSVDTRAVSEHAKAAGRSGIEIGRSIRSARLEAIREYTAAV
jgi:tRNA nucleotidyltransferase (CCA-adding enzyme)